MECSHCLTARPSINVVQAMPSLEISNFNLYSVGESVFMVIFCVTDYPAWMPSLSHIHVSPSSLPVET